AMTTSCKYQQFVCEPIGCKDVTALAGISCVLGCRLRRRGYGTAYSMLGRYIQLCRDPCAFRCWMQNICGANFKQACDCYRCLNDWYTCFN
ncbi:hypothetical protein GH825_30065, partial [Bacillus thuringiensis]|nr:hypothetical protein [Bacillus thuringiensis]